MDRPGADPAEPASPLVLRLSRLVLVATVALFFTMVAFGNVTAPGANWQFVTHVMAMDTTFRDPAIMGRAITDPTLQRAAYVGIIAWQCLTTVLLWIGVVKLARAIRGPRRIFMAARSVAILGLTAGLMLYGIGFLVVAGEWFAMWQSPTWNGQSKAAIFILLIGLTLLHLCGSEPD